VIAVLFLDAHDGDAILYVAGVKASHYGIGAVAAALTQKAAAHCGHHHRQGQDQSEGRRRQANQINGKKSKTGADE